MFHTCLECNKTYNSKGSLARHLRKHGSPEKMYRCQECPKVYDAKCLLKTHVETKHNRKSVGDCSLCEKSFYSDYGFRRHMRSHAGEYTHYCTVCEPRRGFQEKHDLDAHMCASHDHPRLFICDVCVKKFSSKAALNRHCVDMCHQVTLDRNVRL